MPPCHFYHEDPLLLDAAALPQPFLFAMVSLGAAFPL